MVEEREDFSKHPQSVFDTLRQMLEKQIRILTQYGLQMNFCLGAICVFDVLERQVPIQNDK